MNSDIGQGTSKHYLYHPSSLLWPASWTFFFVPSPVSKIKLRMASLSNYKNIHRIWGGRVPYLHITDICIWPFVKRHQVPFETRYSISSVCIPSQSKGRPHTRSMFWNPFRFRREKTQLSEFAMVRSFAFLACNGDRALCKRRAKLCVILKPLWVFNN